MLDIYDSMFGANMCQIILIVLLYAMLITDGWMRYHKKGDHEVPANAHGQVDPVGISLPQVHASRNSWQTALGH